VSDCTRRYKKGGEKGRIVLRKREKGHDFKPVFLERVSTTTTDSREYLGGERGPRDLVPIPLRETRRFLMGTNSPFDPFGPKKGRVRGEAPIYSLLGKKEVIPFLGRGKKKGSTHLRSTTSSRKKGGRRESILSASKREGKR